MSKSIGKVENSILIQFLQHQNSLTPEERKQEYEELKEYNNFGPKIVTDNMIEFEQKLVCIEDALGEVFDLDEYFEEGWHISQISAGKNVCYVLLEREHSASNDNMICE